LNRVTELETMVVDLQKEKIYKQLGSKEVVSQKNVNFSENLVQPSVHVQKKQQEGLQELKEQLDARKLIEQKLQSQIQMLIQKNKDLEVRLDKSKNSIKSAFENKPSPSPSSVNHNPQIVTKPITSKSKSDPEIDISTFMKSPSTTKSAETVRPADPFSVTNDLPKPKPSYSSYQSPFTKPPPTPTKQSMNSKLEPEIHIRL